MTGRAPLFGLYPHSRDTKFKVSSALPVVRVLPDSGGPPQNYNNPQVSSV
jgi:hypothetical protein